MRFFESSVLPQAMLFLSLLFLAITPAVGANDPGHDSLYIERAGDNVSGTFNFSGTFYVPSPGSDMEAATRKYVDDTVNAANDSIWNQSGSDIYYDGGNVGIGTNDTAKPLHVVNGIQVEDIDDDGFSTGLNIRRSRNGTSLQDDDGIGSFIFEAHDGTEFNQAAYLLVDVAGPVSSDKTPARFDFYTDDDAGSFPELRMRLNPSGNLGIGVNDPTSKLHVNGSANVSNTVYADSFVGDGSGLTNISSSGGSLWTNSSGDVTYTDGNVGIGTNSPQEELEVNGTISSYREGVDITPSTLSHIAKAENTTLDGAEDFAFKQNYLFIASKDNNALTIVDVSNPNQPKEVKSITEGFNGSSLSRVTEVEIQGDYAYTLQNDGHGLDVFDISNPENPVVVSGIQNSSVTPIASPWYLAFGKGHLFVNSENGIGVINNQDPTNLEYVTQFTDGTDGASVSGGGRMKVYNEVLYSANYNSDSIQILNVTDPSSITKLEDITNAEGPYTFGAPRGFRIREGRLYATTGFSGDSVEIFDVSDPANWKHLGRITDSDANTQLDMPVDIDVVGDYGFVPADNSQALQVLDVSNGSNPKPIGILQDGTNGAHLKLPTKVSVRKGKVYVSSDDSPGVIEIIDIPDSNAPTSKVGELWATKGTIDELTVENELQVEDSISSGPISSDGDIASQGTIEANKFVGDGSGLTNISSSGGSLWTNSSGDATYIDGNVGINTTNPSLPLHVSSKSAFGNSVTSTKLNSAFGPRAINLIDDSASIRVWRSTSNTGNAAQIELIQGTNDDPYNALSYWTHFAVGDGTYRIVDRKAGGDNGEARLILDESGNIGLGSTVEGNSGNISDFDFVVTNKSKVGIGTSNPDGKLDVQGNMTVADSQGRIKIGYGRNDNSVIDSDKNRLYLRSNKFVQLGTASGANGAIAVHDKGEGMTINDEGSIMWSDNTVTTQNTQIDLEIERSSAGVLKVTNGSGDLNTLLAGDIGVGTTSPSNALTLGNGTNQKNIYLSKTGVASGSGDAHASQKITFETKEDTIVGDTTYEFDIFANATGIGSDSDFLTVEDPSDTDIISFYDNNGVAIGSSYTGSSGTSSVPINGALIEGNVGIGTTSPGSLLDVSGTAQASTSFETGDLVLHNSDGLYSDNSGKGGVRFGTEKTNGARPLILESGNNGSYTDGEIRLETDGEERVRVDDQGNVGIGTSSPNQSVEVDGGVRLNTTKTKPTCSNEQRGTMWFEKANAGSDDIIYSCMKNSSDSYNWVMVARGG